jgi:diaminopimelate decarboxylase
VLKLLHEQGVGAEVISPYELWLAKQLGVPAERTIYNGPAKSDDSIRDAVERRIQVINCNHREELPRVAQIARQLGVRARVALRVNTSVGWSGQFGTPIQGGEALAAYREALACLSCRWWVCTPIAAVKFATSPSYWPF